MGRSIYILPNGESASKWSKRNNISYSTVVNYLNKGYMTEDACKLAKKAHEEKVNKPILMYNNKPLFGNIPISMYVSVARKIRKTKCSVEEAIESYKYNLTHEKKHIIKNRRPVVNTVTGKEYKSIFECALDYKVCPCTIRYKINKGCELQYKDVLMKGTKQ